MSKRIPRLEMNGLAPNVQETLAARVKRLGYLGEFFKCSGHNPDVLVSFMAMTEALKEALPGRLTEVGSLTVAGAMGNAYERNQHERLSEKLGFGRDWVAAVNKLAPDAAGPMSEDERAVQRLALAFVERTRDALEQEVNPHLHTCERRAQLVRRRRDEFGFELACQLRLDPRRMLGQPSLVPQHRVGEQRRVFRHQGGLLSRPSSTVQHDPNRKITQSPECNTRSESIT